MYMCTRTLEYIWLNTFLVIRIHYVQNKKLVQIYQQYEIILKSRVTKFFSLLVVESLNARLNYFILQELLRIYSFTVRKSSLTMAAVESFYFYFFFINNRLSE